MKYDCLLGGAHHHHAALQYLNCSEAQHCCSKCQYKQVSLVLKSQNRGFLTLKVERRLHIELTKKILVMQCLEHFILGFLVAQQLYISIRFFIFYFFCFGKSGLN